MKRIFHPYNKWEDFPAGFYDGAGKNKPEVINKVVELFCSPKLTEHYMRLVTATWPNSCEHNLTNPAMNRIAYIGQGACCIYAGVSSTITMEAWSSVPKEFRDQADKIAAIVLKEWEELYAEN